MRGHLRKRGKSSWQLKFDDGRDPKTGKRRTRFRTVRGSRKDAEAVLRTLLYELDRGVFVDPGKLTVAEFLRSWVDDYAKTNVSRKTFERYNEIVEKHLIPAFGGLKLSALRPVHIQREWGKAQQSGRRDGKGGLSAQTIQHHHRVLSLALTYAVRLQLLSTNPAKGVVPPRVERREIAVFSDSELAALLKAIQGTRLYMPVLLASTTGLRRGEVFGLRWQDVDLENATLSVVQALEQTKSGLRFKAPKTSRSRRKISLPELTVEALRVHKGQQAGERLALGQGKDPDDLVFTDLDGTRVNMERVSRKFSEKVRRLGLPRVTFHGLRHTHLTQLLRTGVHPKIASERAGHSSVSMTLDTYSHVIPGMQEDAAKKVDMAMRTALER